MLVFATLLSVGCSRERGVLDRDSTPSTLVIKLHAANGAALFRGVEVPATESGEDLKASIDFTRSEIFVIGALNEVLSHAPLTNASTAGGAGQTYPSAVPSGSKVFIVANIPAGDYAAVVAKTTLTDVQNYVSSMKDLNGGSGSSWKTVTLANANGQATAMGAPVGGVATAEVTLSPVVSRLELVSLTGGEDTEGRIVSFTVSGVYVDDFKPSYTYVGAGSGALTTMGMTTSDSDYTSWISTHAMGDEGTWESVAAVHPALPAASPDLAGTPVITELWGYNVAPDAAPKLIIKLTDVKYSVASDSYASTKEDIADETYYLTVKTYKDSASAPLTSFERGHVYRVGTSTNALTFTLDDLGLTPNQSDITLMAKVSVTGWVVDLPTAEF